MTAVRDMEPADADVVAALHVRAWKEAYAGGLMPREYLDQLSVESRAHMWRESLARVAPPRTVRLVADSDGVRGFLVGGAADAQGEASVVAEIYALNVDPQQWGCGHGTALVHEALARFNTHGFSRAVLWVHRDNIRARRFYERLGWECEGPQREQEVLGVVVPEVRYQLAWGAA